MSTTKLFCTPPKLAKEIGLDVRVIRDMCQKKIIPCEIYNGRYHILHDRAILILTKRAEDFEGHYRPERSAVLEAIQANRPTSKKRTARQQQILDQLRGFV